MNEWVRNWLKIASMAILIILIILILTSYNEDFEQTKKNLEKFHQQFDNLSKDFEQTKTKLERVQQQFDNLNKDFEQTNTKLEKVQQQSDNLNKDLEQTKTKLEKVQQQSDNLNKNLEQTKTKLGKVQQQSDNLNKDLEQTKNDLENLRQQFEDKTEQYKSNFDSEAIHTGILFIGSHQPEQRGIVFEQDLLEAKETKGYYSIIALPQNAGIVFQQPWKTNYPADIASVGNIYSSGMITATGTNIHGNATVDGTIHSNSRLSTGEYIQIDGVAVDGKPCSPNGLIGRDNKGRILSCQSNTWNSIGYKSLSLVGWEGLEFTADINYKSIIVTLSSMVQHQGRVYAIYGIYINNAEIGRVQTNAYLPTTQKQFFSKIVSGSRIRISIIGQEGVWNSDVRADLTN